MLTGLFEMQLFLLALIVPALVLAVPDVENRNPFKNADKWIEIINSDPKSTWKAGRNFHQNIPRSYMKTLLGLLPKNGRLLPTNSPHSDISDNAIPKTFDARKKWKFCKSLQEIRDQGYCGSCWAVSTVTAFADRLCIATHGKFNGHLSAEQLMDCCFACGKGCSGGWPERAWNFFIEHGIVTGGDYNSSEGCQPYSKQPCEHHIEGPRPKCPSLPRPVTPACKHTCTNKNYTTVYERDMKKAKSAYVVKKSVKEIQKEILKFGPVTAGFDVYEDFLTYKSGVYQKHPDAKQHGGHAVKIIGWGTEKGTPYWLVQNSWNYDWGQKGLFKIKRGNNECGFEAEVTAGIPDV